MGMENCFTCLVVCDQNIWSEWKCSIKQPFETVNFFIGISYQIKGIYTQNLLPPN